MDINDYSSDRIALLNLAKDLCVEVSKWIRKKNKKIIFILVYGQHYAFLKESNGEKSYQLRGNY